MFTGIIESVGIVKKVETSGANKSFWLSSPISEQLHVDQSVSHNGVCLTVEATDSGMHRVTAIAETLSKSDIDSWEPGKAINLERCMVMNGRLDGHIVQGHVDTTAKCIELKNSDGSWLITFQYPEKFAHLVIEKGSIAINGTSLTVFDVSNQRFSVAVIPFTYQHTNIGEVEPGSIVNIEFDIIGKYIHRMYETGFNQEA